MNDFFKFPATSYLLEPNGITTRGDKVLSEAECSHFLQHHITVEEKVDGANLGISFDVQGNLILQNRGGWIVPPFVGQWKKLEEWISPKLDPIFEALLDRYILFGEWCYAQHSVFYSQLPDYFIGFDIFDKKEKRFLSVYRRNHLLKGMNIFPVHQIEEGIFSLDELKSLMHKSYYGEELCEGLYLRYDEGDWLVERAKMVRGSFKQQIEEHWSKKKMRLNRIKTSEE